MYFIRCYKNNDRIFLFKKVDNVMVCVYYSLCFTDIYNYIKSNNIDFKDIKIINLSFYDLFYHFVSEESLNPNIKEGIL